MSYPDFYIEWLKDSRHSQSRIVLIEIKIDDKLYGLSDYPYASDDLIYDDLIVDAIEIEESIDNPSGIGDLTFIDDKRDIWNKYDFSGGECKIFLGDIDWSREQFKLIVLSTIENIERTDDFTYRVNFDNKDYRLDKIIESNYINDQLIPFALGDPFNCAPILTDYGKQEYQFNSKAVEAISVRDIGLTPASVSNQYSDGKIILGVLPAGQVTGDVRESNNTLIKAINYLLTLAVVSSESIALINLQGQQDYKIGWYSRNQDTYRDVINYLVEPLGISLRRNTLGVHELISLKQSNPILTLDADDIFSISAAGFEPKKEQIEVGFLRNFSVQTEGSLALVSDNGLSIEDKERYGLAYKTLSKSTGSTHYSNESLLRIDTLLTDEVQANQELERLANEYTVTRKKWSIEATVIAAILSIGDTITINDTALQADVVVIGFKKNATSQEVLLEVLQ